jgi:phosphopantothenoylcysteine decarboxylase / phosphopantothenate---cysteine ligase
MKRLRVLVTAGPTREPIDPVRFITNHSTGSMGYAIARCAHRLGHQVTLISGPASLAEPAGVKTIRIETAQEMYAEVKKHFLAHDSLVMAAAVSDFRPRQYSAKKLKTNSRTAFIQLKKNPDILQWAGKQKTKKIIVGFCMETENMFARALEKMCLKQADIIIANKISKFAMPFGPGRTDILLIGPDSLVQQFRKISKDKVARILLDKIADLWYKKHSCRCKQR